MPDLPWTERSQMEPGRDYLAMASYLPLVSIGPTVRFFKGVSQVRRQLAGAEGLLGYTLRAKPLARRYWTLSVWTGEETLRAFVRTAPHAQLISALKPVMGPTRFVQWTITAADGRPTWQAALERLSAA